MRHKVQADHCSDEITYRVSLLEYPGGESTGLDGEVLEADSGGKDPRCRPCRSRRGSGVQGIPERYRQSRRLAQERR